MSSRKTDKEKAWEAIWYLANALGYSQLLMDQRMQKLIAQYLTEDKAKRLVASLKEMCARL